jgi:site-specific recombinase XerD
MAAGYSSAAVTMGHLALKRAIRHAEANDLVSRNVSIEEIALLVGHASTRTTEVVYRRELRPVITTGAEIMDELFSGT